jgi:hypothetical protein
MKNFAILSVLLLAACNNGPSSGVTSVPGHGAISVRVEPNPIVAKQVSGGTYDFPFEVIVRETGGRAVNISRVSVNVVFAGGISVGSESWNASEIRAMGHDPALGPLSERRFRFNPRKEVPDDRLFGGVTAELRVEGTDDTGTPTNATTSVTVRR